MIEKMENNMMSGDIMDMPRKMMKRMNDQMKNFDKAFGGMGMMDDFGMDMRMPDFGDFGMGMNMNKMLKEFDTSLNFF